LLLPFDPLVKRLSTNCWINVLEAEDAAVFATTTSSGLIAISLDDIFEDVTTVVRLGGA